MNLDAREALEWARRLKQAERACGCKSGAALMIIAIVCWPIQVAVSGIPHGATGIAIALLRYIAVVIGSAAIGKVAGIAVGRIRHRHLKHQFARRLASLIAQQGG